MSYFGKRPALYGRDTSTDQPIGLFVCVDCGATVTEPNKETHVVWHTTTEERLRALETMAANPPVVINNPPQQYTLQQPSWPYTWGNFSTAGYTLNTGNTTAGNVSSWTFNPPENKDDEGDCGCDCGGACE